MKKISEESLLKLMGGAATGDCDYLQQMADEHEPLEDDKADRAWWDAWAEAFERCANKSN